MIKVPSDLADSLRCPSCNSGVTIGLTSIDCLNPECRESYPVVDGVPVLVNNSKSLFSKSEIINSHKSFFGSRGAFADRIYGMLPTLTRNVRAEKDLRRFAGMLKQGSGSQYVLVIGGGIKGKGMDALSTTGISLIETDVSIERENSIVCDGHDIPFADDTFDGCVIQAVLPFVLDPHRCVSEIHRVLKPGGLIYADTAFIQQVCGGRFDFTRFTHRGQRRLFRSFEEIDSGPTCGPGMALAWSYQFFLLSWARSRIIRGLLFAVARLTSFWLKYLDSWLIDRPGALYTASAFYFIGRKSDKAISDRELVFSYRSAGSE